MNDSDNKSGSPACDKAIKERRKLLLGLGATGAMAVWHKPIISAIVLPAHAQMSPDDEPAPAPEPAPPPVPAEDLCPMIVIGNSVTGPVSGTSTPPVCTLTFDVLSGTAGTPLTVLSITTSTLPADTTFTVDGLGEATDMVGPRVVWRGPAVGAPFCMPFTIVDDLTFTVTASCDASGGDTFTQDFLLSSLV